MISAGAAAAGGRGGATAGGTAGRGVRRRARWGRTDDGLAQDPQRPTQLERRPRLAQAAPQPREPAPVLGRKPVHRPLGEIPIVANPWPLSRCDVAVVCWYVVGGG